MLRFIDRLLFWYLPAPIGFMKARPDDPYCDWFVHPIDDAADRKARTVNRCHSFSPAFRNVAIKRARRSEI